MKDRDPPTASSAAARAPRSAMQRPPPVEQRDELAPSHVSMAPRLARDNFACRTENGELESKSRGRMNDILSPFFGLF
jgi:hypothetical protein